MKEIMVDLDNTLVNFTQMMFTFLEENFGYHFEENELDDYDFSKLFYRKGCSKEEIYNFFNSLYKTENLYTDHIIYTKEYNNIINIINDMRTKGYKIVCHTKVSSKEMKKSKELMFSSLFENVFDEINIEFIEGKKVIYTTKDNHYDYIIDDSPYIIEDYLQNNKIGKVLMPLRTYNKFLLEKNEYKGRIILL